MLSTLCFLRSSPNLESLKIIGPLPEQENSQLDDNFWQEQIYCELPKLHTLKLRRLTCAGFSLVDYILPKVKQLEKIVIYARDRARVNELESMTLLESWRAAAQVEIMLAASLILRHWRKSKPQTPPIHQTLVWIRNDWHLGIANHEPDNPSLTDKEFKKAMKKLIKEIYNPTYPRRRPGLGGIFHARSSSSIVNKTITKQKTMIRRMKGIVVLFA